MDAKTFEEILLVAKKHGVSKFTVKDMSAEFFELPHASLTTQDAKDVLGGIESSLPPDLRTDAVNSADQVLLWSTGQSFDSSMPLTGDASLNGPTI